MTNLVNPDLPPPGLTAQGAIAALLTCSKEWHAQMSTQYAQEAARVVQGVRDSGKQSWDCPIYPVLGVWFVETRDNDPAFRTCAPVLIAVQYESSAEWSARVGVPMPQLSEPYRAGVPMPQLSEPYRAGVYSSLPPLELYCSWLAQYYREARSLGYMVVYDGRTVENESLALVPTLTDGALFVCARDLVDQIIRAAPHDYTWCRMPSPDD